MSSSIQHPYYYGYNEVTKAESTDDEGSHENCSRNKIVKTNVVKYKTEMCKNFSENGYCPYRSKCQFAHGYDQLMGGHCGVKRAYRTKKCKSFWEEGVCRYGFRCQFSHYEVKNKKESSLLNSAKGFFKCENSLGCSRLNGILEKIQY